VARSHSGWRSVRSHPARTDQIAKAAAAATDRLAAAGVPKPPWAAELAEPLQTSDHLRLRCVDRALGHRAEKPVTLEQVTPQAKDEIRYTYDFGNDRSTRSRGEGARPDPAETYPRCVGGRRAAPPDDCGGIWGYEELVEILTDPKHPHHKDRLEWLGWDDASDFDPAAFDPDEVNRDLAKRQ
jgi:Plasmid pRiA4b ORF-3-like protein